MTIDEKLDLLLEKVTSIEMDVNEVKQKVQTLEMTLENETNKNIKVIAEGHLDLSRKLNQAIKITSDIQAKQELQDIYLNAHENRIKTIV